jgi:hypothetical protein
MAHADARPFMIDISPLQCNDFSDAQPAFTAKKHDKVGAPIDPLSRVEQPLIAVELVEGRSPRFWMPVRAACLAIWAVSYGDDISVPRLQLPKRGGPLVV